MLPIKKLRQENNLMQKELASALNIPANTFNQYENGKREPDYDTLKKIADYFNVTTDFLLGRTEENKKNSPSKEDEQSMLMKFVNNDEKKLALIKAVSTLSDDQLKLFEKLLDAAESIE